MRKIMLPQMSKNMQKKDKGILKYGYRKIFVAKCGMLIANVD